jgi:predicted ATPase
VCRKLDGVPLAIELAAACLPLLPLAQVNARLDRSLHLLTRGSRLAPSRQQTLRAAIGWSYDLLSVPERQVFNRLAVFSGGCTLEAAESVVCGADLGGESVFDVLGRLVDKSLGTGRNRMALDQQSGTIQLP